MDEKIPDREAGDFSSVHAPVPAETTDFAGSCRPILPVRADRFSGDRAVRVGLQRGRSIPSRPYRFVQAYRSLIP
jgi:hypothetical protein